MNEVFVVDAVRTPIGKYGGMLASVRPDDLAADVLRELQSRQADRFDLDEVVLGNVNGAGEDNRNVARMSVLLAGLPHSVTGATVNRLCGSGMEAVIMASRAIAVGDADACVVGGVESMSRAPLVLQRPEKLYQAGHEQLWNTAVGWRMVNPAMEPTWTASMGEGAEILAEEYRISREEQDAFALSSHVRAHATWVEGRFADEIVPVRGFAADRDESVRPNASIDALGRLKPVFRENGSVTAGNSSPMSDGAAAVLLMSGRRVSETGVRPLARIVASAVHGVEPQRYGIGPVEALRRALKRARLDFEDLAAVELNEAFAAQCLACLREWPELDPSLVNQNGGAIALGHPLGSSGARILGTLVHQLSRCSKRFGVATMCIGVGQGIAVVVEAMA